MEIINSHANNENDDDDLEIPMLIKKTTKLKSFDFANRQSFLFNNFKDIDVQIEPKHKSLSSNNDSNSIFKPFKEIDCVNKVDIVKSPIESSKNNEKISEEKEIVPKKLFCLSNFYIYLMKN
jgi:hypothetical protein